MFHHETPSRVLRRIDELEQAELDMPTLPDLPPMSDDSLQSSAPPSPAAPARHDTPFTSTPAPSTASYHSFAVSNPSSASSQRTILAPVSRRLSPKEAPAPIQNSENEHEHDEMIVLSGSDEQAPPKPAGTTRNRKAAPGTPMPFGDRTNEQTPEMGRHASFESSHAKNSVEEQSLTPVANNNNTKLSRAFATPSPSTDADAAQRRKDHVLMSLKSTARPRFVKGTPHPLRVQSKANDSDNSSSETSSQDLTTFQRAANTSMPSAGAETKGARFNSAKLNAYLHDLNTHLNEENQSMAQALGSANKRLEKRDRENRRLKDQLREMSRAGLSVSLSEDHEDGESDSDREDGAESELQKQLEDIVKSHESIDALKVKIQQAARSRTDDDDSDDAPNVRAQLQEKDDELNELKAEHERQIESLEEDHKQQMLDMHTVFAEKMAALRADLGAVTDSQEDALQKARQERDEAVQRQEEADAEQAAQMKELEDELETYARELSDKDDEIQRLRDEQARLEQELTALQDQIAARQSASVVVGSTERIQELESVVEDLDRELLSRNEEVDSLRSQLDEERKVVASLKAQQANVAQVGQTQAHATKARSPLINEIKDDSREALEEELEQARDEIRMLKHKLDGPAARAEREVQQIKLRTLEAQKGELESRVAELRKQVESSLLTPQRKSASSADRSVLFRSIQGLKTPKTPGQFMSSSPWTPAHGMNTTIAPDLEAIEELKDMAARLQEQLAAANTEIDDKLDKLDLAGMDKVSLATDMAEKAERAALLEVELDRIVGEDGDLERLRRKLEHMRCPSCSTTFDANSVVKLRIDKRAISYAGSSTARANHQTADKLRTALANVNRKLAELQAENEVLQEAAARSASRPSFSQQAALQVDFDRARAEIASLERELDDERSKLKDLMSRAARGESETDKHTAEIRALRARERELQNERGELLRGIAGLQADLGKVRQDAASLGVDLASARRERTETVGLYDFERVKGELDVARRRVEALERQAVGSASSSHDYATEAKGLLVMIRYLKVRVTRESILRSDLALQKALLISEMSSTNAKLGLCSLHRYERPRRPTLKGVATLVLAVKRMERLGASWRSVTALKERLRNDAYVHTRGRPFPAQ